jgi:hypothetical protein
MQHTSKFIEKSNKNDGKYWHLFGLILGTNNQKQEQQE